MFEPDPERNHLLQDRATVRARVTPGASSGPRDLRRLLAIDTDLRRLDDARRGEQLERLVRIHREIAGLRQQTDPRALITSAPASLLAATDLTRALVSRVDDGRWYPTSFSVVAGSDPEAEEFQQYIAGRSVDLRELRSEAEMARRRRPVLAAQVPHGDPALHELVLESRTTSYVAAPVLSGQRVIGFLHADRYGTDTPCTAADRDAVAAFAEHFGLVYQRAVFVTHLGTQRQRLREVFADAAATVDAFCEQELELGRHGPRTPPMPPEEGERTRVDVLLSAREREVLAALATGMSNAQIAHRLVLSEATIKSHLQRINRKLHTSNRSQAVARYLRLTGARLPVEPGR